MRHSSRDKPWTTRLPAPGFWSGALAVMVTCGWPVSPTLAFQGEMMPIDEDANASAPSAASILVRPEVRTEASLVLSVSGSWFGGPSANLPVCTAGGLARQTFSSQISDGAGGMLVIWEDDRDLPASGVADIYAHHVLACGVLDPAWPAAGLALTRAGGDQGRATLTPDGSGGAIVVWTHLVDSGIDDIFAQHVLITGTVDPAWPVNGLAVCTAPGIQTLPKITSDGAGGAFVTWEDRRFGGGGARRVFVQHLVGSGVDPAWPVNGARACPGIEAGQSTPVICSDGAGGAIVTWHDQRNLAATGRDIYSQRMSAEPALLWSPAGEPVCTAGGPQTLNGAEPGFVWIDGTSDVHNNAIVPDGVGGCFISWVDERTFAATEQDVYGQRLTASGSVAGGWDPNGVPLCTDPGRQNGAKILSDGAGGAIATWTDIRPSVFVQHVSGSGVVDGPSNGLAISIAAPTFITPLGVSDGATGAVLAWNDFRNLSTTRSDVFAQHVLTSPAFMVDPLWPVNGAAVSTAPVDQFFERSGNIASDGAGGAIVSWTDNRTIFDVSSTNLDIYAQRILASGSLPLLPDPTELIQDLIAQVHALAAAGILNASQERGLIAKLEEALKALERENTRVAINKLEDFIDQVNGFVGAGTLPAADGEILIRLANEIITALGAASSAQPAASADAARPFSPERLVLFQNYPNPFSRTTTIRFTLPAAARYSLTIYDITGRRVRWYGGVAPAGQVAIDWDGLDDAGVPVGSGVYLYRADAMGVAQTRKMHMK